MAGNGVSSLLTGFGAGLRRSTRGEKGSREVLSSARLDWLISSTRCGYGDFPKIEQYVADLDGLRLSLVFFLSVAKLDRTRKLKKVRHR